MNFRMLRFLFFFQERFYKSLMQNSAATTYKISSLRHVTKDNPTTHTCLLYFPVQEGTSTLPCVPTLLCPNTTRLLLIFPSKHLFTAMVRSKLLLSKVQIMEQCFSFVTRSLLPLLYVPAFVFRVSLCCLVKSCFVFLKSHFFLVEMGFLLWILLFQLLCQVQLCHLLTKLIF